MKVKQLIELLKQENENADVALLVDGGLCEKFWICVEDEVVCLYDTLD